MAGAELGRPLLASVSRRSSERASPPSAPIVSSPAASDNLAQPMLISVFGTPSALTYWGVHLLKTIMQVVYGDYHFIKVDSIDDLREAWDKRDGKSVLLVSECPDTHVANLFIKYEAPTVVFIDKPVDVMCDLVASGTHGGWDGLCFASQSFSALSEISRSPTVFRIESSDYNTIVRDLVAEIFRDVVGHAVEEQIEKVMAIAVPNYASQQNTTVLEQILLHFPQSRRPNCYLSQLTKDVQETIEQVIDQYHPSVTSGKIDQIIWPMTLFSHWDPAGKYYRGPIELVGPQRYLIWGPYMHLPKGDWVATVDIEMTDNYSGNQLMVDVTAGFGTEVLAIGMINLPVQGVFSFKIRFRINEPSLPIEIRFFLKCGAIEGKFALRQAVIQPASEVSIERVTVFESAEC